MNFLFVYLNFKGQYVPMEVVYVCTNDSSSSALYCVEI